MPRNLEQLRKQYNSAAASGVKKDMPGGRRGNMGLTGKPKDAKATIRRLLTYLKPYRLLLVVVLLCMLVSTVTSLAGSYMIAPIIDRLTLAVKPDATIQMTSIERFADGIITSVAGTDAHVLSYLAIAAVVLGTVYLVGIITSYLQARLMIRVSQGTLEKLRNDLFVRMERLPLRFFDGKPTGDIMSRYTNDIDTIDTMINNSLTALLSGAITLIGTFVFMISTNWILTMVTVCFIPIFLFGAGAISKKSRKYYTSQQAALGAVNGYMEETVSGQKVIKVFNHEDECVEEFGELNNDMRNTQFLANFWGSTMGPLMGNTSQISYAVTVGVGGILMITGSLTPGGLTVFANYSRHFSMPITNLSQQMVTVFAALAGAERVFDIMDTDPEEPDKKNASDMPDMRGDVVLDDVSFGYDPEKLVLKHISLYAHPGQKIAFVGSTGAGKTTITNLLNRFYDVQEGTITIDGVNIMDIKREVLRKNITMVLQDTHLFTGTVMENIRYGRLDATDMEVVAAARTASADSFIRKLSDGYQTKLEGDGANLSQGQRQLISIARAALSKAPILVLDEATSSVDTRTERMIERGMDRLMKNRTTFVIAHRLSTVRNSDAIMVLEHGEIMERGSHEDLLAMKGRYYELYTGKTELS